MHVKKVGRPASISDVLHKNKRCWLTARVLIFRKQAPIYFFSFFPNLYSQMVKKFPSMSPQWKEAPTWFQPLRTRAWHRNHTVQLIPLSQGAPTWDPSLSIWPKVLWCEQRSWLQVLPKGLSPLTFTGWLKVINTTAGRQGWCNWTCHPPEVSGT